MKKQLAVGLTLAALSFGTVVAPFSYNEQKAVAVSIKGYVPRVELEGNVAKLIIPQNLMQAGLREALKINEQRLKDTEFNRFTLKGTDCKVVGDKLQVSGVLQVEHRERIGKNPFTGKVYHSPWVSASGRITQLFSVQVRDNQTRVSNIGNPKIEGLEGRWYAELISLAGRYVGPQLTPKVTQALSNFNGLDVRQFAIDYGTTPIASRLGVNEGAVKAALAQNIGPINAGFTNQSEFVMAFSFPQLK